MEGNGQPIVPDNRQSEDTSTFNLKWLVSTVIAIWPWLLGSIIVALIIGNLYLRYTIPQWRSSAELLLMDSKGGSGGGGNDMMDMMKGNKKINIDNEIEIIRSRTLMVKVIKELHLNVSYSILGRLKSTDVYKDKPFVFVVADSVEPYYSCKVNITDANGYSLTEDNNRVIHGRWNDTIKTGNGFRAVLQKTDAFNVSGVQYTINVQPPAAVGGYGVDVAAVGKTGSYLNISMVDALPDRSVDIINKLMEVYAKNNVQNRVRTSDSTMNFIARRILLVDSDLNHIEHDIERFKQSNGLADMGAQSTQLITDNSKVIENMENQQFTLDVIGAISTYMNKISDQDDKPIILPASLLDNTGLSDLMDKYNNLQAEIETSRIANTDQNPITRTLIKQRNEIRQNIIASLASSNREAKIKLEKIQKQMSTINSDIREVPTVERAALAYSRTQAIKQDMYIFLLKKKEETAIEKAATVADANVVDPASINGIVFPNHSRVLMLSFLFGALIPFGIIMLRRGLNIKIINKSDIIKQTPIPIIGEIGNNQDSESIAVKKNSRTIISEQFRALRTNLQYLLTNKDEKVLMITSSMSGEGKSFIAVNLAITLAMSGKKVALMELDLRKPKISKMLGVDNSVGFSTYSIGKASFNDIIIPSDIEPNLFIIPSGPIPPNPSELILLHRTEELFSYLRANYDYVILDTSPLGLVTDAQLLNKYADTTLYIVRQGYTYKQQLNIPNELYHSGKITKLSLIVNDMIANRGFSYGYGYEEHYGYGYGYGYGGYGYGSYGGGGYYLEDENKGFMGWLRSKRKNKDS